MPVRRHRIGVASSKAVHWLVPGGLLIGLAYVGLYRMSWRMFGEVAGVRLMPALAVWLLDVCVLGLPLILGAARTADHWSSPRSGGARRAVRSLAVPGAVALVVVLVLKLALWIAVPAGIAGWPTDWKRYFNWMYPWPIYRPLILAPIWGRWALGLALGIGPASSRHPLPAGAPEGRSIASTLGWFVLVAALTSIYCGRHGQWVIGCLISLAVLGTTFLFCVVATRRFSGHAGFMVYAAALVAEVVFLLVYLASCQYIYRY